MSAAMAASSISTTTASALPAAWSATPGRRNWRPLIRWERWLQVHGTWQRVLGKPLDHLACEPPVPNTPVIESIPKKTTTVKIGVSTLTNKWKRAPTRSRRRNHSSRNGVLAGVAKAHSCVRKHPCRRILKGRADLPVGRPFYLPKQKAPLRGGAES